MATRTSPPEVSAPTAPGSGVPPPRGPVAQPKLGPLGWARWVWRQLTSMRTALFLLLLLSVAAVPGSIFPQRSIDPVRVTDFLADHTTVGPVLDRLGFFAVYASPWFASIYLLLTVSLIGCIVPRSRLHLRNLRARPPRAPRRLERLDEHRVFLYDGTPDEALAAAARMLRRRRFRVDTTPDSVSAENGYLRETGNLVFHIALCAVIVGVAVSHLFGWRGDVILAEGDSFASTVSTYNIITPGPLTDLDSIPPFTIDLRSMVVKFEEAVGGSQYGAPREFLADVTTTERPGDAPVQQEISPNHPVTLDGVDVFLLGNGYAPVITVKDASGKVLYRQATPFLAQDNNYTSVGAVKVPAARPDELGLSGAFLPTVDETYADGPLSTFPDDLDPELALTVWTGDLFPGGRPQSVYSLDTTSMTELTGSDGKPLLLKLKPGQTVQLPGGRGSVTFDKVDRWAGLSARVDPGKGITLVAALAALLGLLGSLLIRRRRVFVRAVGADEAGGVPGGVPGGSGGGTTYGGATDGEDGVVEGAGRRTVVTIGGLAKNADPGLGPLLEQLQDELSEGRTN